MAAIVAGIYKQGHIELLERPAGVPEGRVRVVVMGEESAPPKPRAITYGKYRTEHPSTLEDFRDAESRDEQAFDDR